MRANRWRSAVIAVAVLSSGIAFAGGDKNKQAQLKPGEQAALAEIDKWSDASKKAAKAMLQKYGAPDEKTASMWIWHDNGPWKRTILYSEAVDHNFPMPHKDVLEQFVNYDVPADKFDELAKFDGSVIAERTKGELSARCDKEAANLLAINLADDVITGKKSVEEARQFYGQSIQKVMKGNMTPYTSGFVFEVARRNINNPDQPLAGMGSGGDTATGGGGEEGKEQMKGQQKQE